MASEELIVVDFATYVYKSSTPGFVPGPGLAGRWRSTGTFTYARSWGEMRGLVNSLTAQLTIQATNDMRVPATSILVGSSINANGMLDPAAATSLSLAGYRFIRAGWTLTGDNTNIGSAVLGGVIQLFAL